VSNETNAKQIIDAAYAMIAERGIAGVTMRSIASEVGCSAPNIYNLFPNKEELLVAIAVEQLEAMTSGLRQHLRGIIGTINKLRKCTWFILDFIETQPHFVTLIIRVIPQQYWSSGRMADSLREQANILAEIVEEGKRAGEVRSAVNMRLFKQIYFGGMERLFNIWLLHGMRWRLSDSTDEFTNLVFEIIQKQPVENLSFKCPFVEKLEILEDAQWQKR